MLAVTVPAWIWRITTVTATVVTLALILVLTAHVLITAVPLTRSWKVPLMPLRFVRGEDSSRPADTEAALRRRLATAAAALLACFAVVVLVRFGIILAERPGP